MAQRRARVRISDRRRLPAKLPSGVDVEDKAGEEEFPPPKNPQTIYAKRAEDLDRDQFSHHLDESEGDVVIRLAKPDLLEDDELDKIVKTAQGRGRRLTIDVED